MSRLVPWRRKGLLPSFFDMGFPEVDEFFDLLNFHPMRTDLRETEDEYILEADLPGCDKNNIEIRYEDGNLTVSAKQKEEREEKAENYLRRERRQGKFCRTIPVPENVDDEKINASFENGVLTVVMPKKTPSKPSGRIIDIE